LSELLHLPQIYHNFIAFQRLEHVISHDISGQQFFAL